MPKFSFVIPCYRSEKTITAVVEEIKSEMAAKRPGDDYEIVLVNDCSPDNVWSVIEGLANTEKNVIGINLAKNFGQHSAASVRGWRGSWASSCWNRPRISRAAASTWRAGS